MSHYFPKPYERSSRNIKIEFDLSNYATKADLKGAADIDTSNLAANSDLASLKAEVVKIDIDKLKAGFADLSKLSNVVVKIPSSNRLVSKAQNNSDKQNLEKKIWDVDFQAL